MTKPDRSTPGGPSSSDLSGRSLGDYHVIRRLGRGGMAEVYLAEQRSLDRKVALKHADELLERVGLADRGRHLPAQLSRGQQQRVALARAFATNAPVILADEPTAALDPEGAEQVMQAFQDLTRDLARVVVVVTHNTELARRYCDSNYVCARGKIMRPAVHDSRKQKRSPLKCAH